MRERPRAVSLGLGYVLVASLACTAAVTTDHPVATTSAGSQPTSSAPAPGADPADALAAARSHIRHVIFLIKENRSFDTLFGRFPGADGPPARVPALRKDRSVHMVPLRR